MASYKKYSDISLHGTNGLSAKSAFVQRKAYEAYFPTNDPLFPAPIDFYTKEQRNYGCIDARKNYILPNVNYLEQLAGTNKVIYALDFVADAYRGFLFYMTTKASLAMKDDDNRIRDGWQAEAAWHDANEYRKNLKNNLYMSFVNSYMDIDAAKMIGNFMEFSEIFLNDFLQYTDNTPLTYSGYLNSTFYNRRTSGLCIEISQDSHEDDRIKFDKYINNVNFRNYAQAAAAHGFLIDKHAPFRLIANLNSPKMRDYLDNRMRLNLMPRSGETSTTEIPNLEAYTYHKHTYDIDEYGNGVTNTKSIPGKSHQHDIIRYEIIPNNTPKGIVPNKGFPSHSHFLEPPEISWSNDQFYQTYFNKTINLEIEDLKDLVFDMYTRFSTDYPALLVTKHCDSNSSRASEYHERNSFYGDMLIVKKNLKTISREEFDESYEDIFWMKTFFLIRIREMKVELNLGVKANVLSKIEDLYFSVDKETSLTYIDNYLKQFH